MMIELDLKCVLLPQNREINFIEQIRHFFSHFSNLISYLVIFTWFWLIAIFTLKNYFNLQIDNMPCFRTLYTLVFCQPNYRVTLIETSFLQSTFIFDFILLLLFSFLSLFSHYNNENANWTTLIRKRICSKTKNVHIFIRVLFFPFYWHLFIIFALCCNITNNSLSKSTSK